MSSTTNDSTNLSAALALMAGGVYALTAGQNYDFTTAISGNNVLIAIPGNCDITNPEYLPGATDTTVFENAGLIFTKDFTATNNEFAIAVQGIFSAFNSTGPSEKALIYVCGENKESSNTYLNDFVGIETEMYIQSDLGRVWGYHALVQVGGTGQYDGFATGIELEMHNIGGTTQTDVLNTSTAKNAVNAIAAEGISTNAIAIISENAYSKLGQFVSGITFWPNSIIENGSAFIIPNDIPIRAWDSAGTNTINLMYCDSTGNLVLGSDNASVSIIPPINVEAGLSQLKIIGTATETLNGQLSLGTGTSSTANAGTAAALPSAPNGYIMGSLNGFSIKIPFYNE